MSNTGTALDLDAIEGRVKVATEGPWRWLDPGGKIKQALVAPGHPFQIVVPVVMPDVYPSQVDAEFIAAARTDVPALIAEVRRLRHIIEESQP